MVTPKCTQCKTASRSIFHLNVIGKGEILICPSCNKKRVNAENKILDKLDNIELHDSSIFKKEYYKNKV